MIFSSIGALCPHKMRGGGGTKAASPRLHMIYLRRSDERGHFNHGWLDTYHTFSFADYFDPKHMGFKTLRVINEDRVQPSEGFPTHGHQDMEIITYIIEGELQHRDSMGHGSVIRAGEVQYMNAGTGVRHSEFNPSKADWVHLLQIWILPPKGGLPPSYDQRVFSVDQKRDKLCRIASGPRAGGPRAAGTTGSRATGLSRATRSTATESGAPESQNDFIEIYQDLDLYACVLTSGKVLTHHPSAARNFGWVQVIRGNLALNGENLGPGDGAGIGDEASLEFRCSDSENKSDAEFILFEIK